MADAGSIRPKVGVAGATCLGVGLALAGCGGVDTGVVEVQWVFVDRDGDPIFPAGQFEVGNRDSCDLPGSGGVSYGLSVRLHIAEASCGDPQDESCRVTQPLGFSCETSRGSDPDIPSSDDPYLFELEPVIQVAGSAEPCLDASPCIAAPGPRERKVRPGLVTDLQVYQFVVDVDQGADEPLNLGACDCA